MTSGQCIASELQTALRKQVQDQRKLKRKLINVLSLNVTRRATDVKNSVDRITFDFSATATRLSFKRHQCRRAELKS